MFDGFDPIAFALRLAGAFYVFAGIVAGRAALMSSLLDTALAGLTAKPVAMRERALTLWLIGSAWLVFASGVLLMVLAREALWAFILCALTQAFYLTIAAPYYFDVEDPPDPQGRRQTTNAFFVYFGATVLVIWASGRYLTPVSDLHPVLSGVAWTSLAAFAVYMIWQSIASAQAPKFDASWPEPETGDAGFPEPGKAYDPRMLRVALSRDGGGSPVKNQKTGADIALDSLALSTPLKTSLEDWMRDGDPGLAGHAYSLSERLSQERPDIAVAEPGIPMRYFGYAIPSPYADPDTGAPQWDRMIAVKLMCDYDCYPVWAAYPDAIGDMPPQVLEISSDLEDALLDWQDRFDASFNPRDPAKPKWPLEDIQAHERAGLDLARRVKLERPELSVFVQSARGVLIVDVGRPPDEWALKSP